MNCYIGGRFQKPGYYSTVFVCTRVSDQLSNGSNFGRLFQPH